MALVVPIVLGLAALGAGIYGVLTINTGEEQTEETEQTTIAPDDFVEIEDILFDGTFGDGTSGDDFITPSGDRTSSTNQITGDDSSTGTGSEVIQEDPTESASPRRPERETRYAVSYRRDTVGDLPFDYDKSLRTLTVYPSSVNVGTPIEIGGKKQDTDIFTSLQFGSDQLIYLLKELRHLILLQRLTHQTLLVPFQS